MYQKYYKLDKEPFHITPDPEFLFLSESNKQAMATIIWGIEGRKGFIAITGPVGVGKTLIIRSYLANRATDLTKIIYVFNPNVSFEELLETICLEVNVEVVPGKINRTIRNLQLFLIDVYKEGRTVVLIVDEAQNMPTDTLENLRMLSNLETGKDKLIQIVLVGQPELDELLGKYELRQLEQRIAMHATISVFTPKESKAYIDHRLGIAGARTAAIFTGTAVRKIIKEAKGIPRRINILCDNALINACGLGVAMVIPKAVKGVVADFRKKPGRKRLKLGFAASMAALCLLGASFLFFRHGYFGSAAQNPPVAREGKTAVVSSSPGPAEDKIVVRKTEGGDTIPSLAKEIYGHSDDEVLRPAVENNPRIKDMHQLFPGDALIFPVLPKEKASPPPAGIAAEAGTGVADIPKTEKKAQKEGFRAKIVATKTVGRGDTLSSLAREIYGRSADEVLKFVQENNPRIEDVNNVPLGSVISFPELPERMSSPPSLGGKKGMAAPATGNRENAKSQAKPESLKAEVKTGQPQTKIVATKTVGRGDTLSSLAREIYGRSADEVLKFVQENNPRIKNVNNVPLGSVIRFPELPERMSFHGRSHG